MSALRAIRRLFRREPQRIDTRATLAILDDVEAGIGEMKDALAGMQRTFRKLDPAFPRVPYDGTASDFGAYERPDLFLWIGTTVVLVGCVFCALRALGAF